MEGSVRTAIKGLGPADLATLARAALDAKKPDTHLLLGLLYAFDKSANPALAKREFDQAVACGAAPKAVAALQSLGAEPEEKAPEPQDAGFALDFNGASDYVELPDKKPHPFRLKTFTVEAWVWHRPGGLAEQVVIAKNLGWTRATSYSIYVSKDRWAYATAFTEESDFRITREPCAAGQWVHCALVCDDLDRTFYVNGKFVEKSKARRGTFYDEKPLDIGCRYEDGNPGAFWNGAIDEVRLSIGARYRADFTPERKLTLDAKTHLLLHFDEGKGEAATDASRFKNHARINGAQFARPDELKLPDEPPPEPKPPPPKDKPPPK